MKLSSTKDEPDTAKLWTLVRESIRFTYRYILYVNTNFQGTDTLRDSIDLLRLIETKLSTQKLHAIDMHYGASYIEDWVNVIRVTLPKFPHISLPEESEDPFADELYNLSVSYNKDLEEQKLQPRKTLSKTVKLLGKFNKPSQLVEELDKYVVDQHEVKKAISMHLFNHYKGTIRDKDLKKENLLIIGETGTGKTYTVETAAQILNKKLKVMDVTSFTSEGYVGNSLGDFLGALIKEASELKNGFADMILFIDEFDKLASGMDVISKVQEELLTLIEGKSKLVEPGGRATMMSVDYRDLCIILGGAFTSTIEKKSQGSSKSIGFKYEEDKGRSELTRLDHDDIIKHGIKRELVGRIGNIVQTQPLSEDAIRRIITEPKNCILEYYTKMFKIHGIDDKVSDEDIQILVDKSKEFDLGARGLWAAAQYHFANRLYY
tara:strand:+ start:22023 stop:23324 length:1302 start_codon:yes stop_codon:yes gene_type:complete